MSLLGKIAVVTGAGRGIGRAIALHLAKERALVVVNYQKNAEAAAAVVNEITRLRDEAFAVQGDIGTVQGISRFFQTLDDELTRRRGSNHFDILVNNAGIFTAGNVETSSEEDFDRTFAVDVKGPFFVAQQAIPRLATAAGSSTFLRQSRGIPRRAMPPTRWRRRPSTRSRWCWPSSWASAASRPMRSLPV